VHSAAFNIGHGMLAMVIEYIYIYIFFFFGGGGVCFAVKHYLNESYSSFKRFGVEGLPYSSRRAS